MTWWRRALWIGGFGCLWLSVWDDPPLHTGAYLQDVTADAATIAMITSTPAMTAVVVRDDAGEVVARVEGSASRRRHALRVTGLTPARRYSYEFAVDGEVADRGHIATAPADDRAAVRFAFLGDSGAQPWWVWLQRTAILHWPARWGWFPDREAVTAVGRAVADYGPDFVLHLGDVIYPRGQHAHYRPGFFRPFAAALRDAPFYAVLGNHDVMDADGQQLLANFRLPESEATGDGRCVSFARGPLRVLTLDCNTDRSGDRYQPGHPSHAFLLAELARCTEPWIVVASHFPMRSASRQRDRGELLLTLLPELAEHGVSLYLSGHDHCYQRFLPRAGEPPLVVSGGGGKDLYEVRPDPRAAVLRSAHHWCSAETRGGTLVVRAHGLDGGILDTFECPLPAGEELERVRQVNPGRAARIERLRGS